MLRRLNAIPDRYMFSPNFSDHVNNGSAFSELTGRDDFTLGTLRLDSLEVRRMSDRANMYNYSPQNVDGLILHMEPPIQATHLGPTVSTIGYTVINTCCWMAIGSQFATNRQTFGLKNLDGHTFCIQRAPPPHCCLSQVAVVTLDLSALSRNVTYGQHYQLAVYLDCKPCPTRYQCMWEVEPPTCSTPR